jgi:hypothetical protein
MTITHENLFADRSDAAPRRPRDARLHVDGRSRPATIWLDAGDCGKANAGDHVRPTRRRVGSSSVGSTNARWLWEGIDRPFAGS